MYILNIIKKIFYLLDKDTFLKYLILQLVFFLSALIQVVGIASLAPFVAILSNIEIIHTNKLLNWAYLNFSFETEIQFVMCFAIISIVLILTSNAISAVTLWVLLKFSIIFGGKLQKRLYQNYLCRPYLYHKTENYTRAIAMVSSEVPRFVYMVFQPFLLLTSQLLIAVIVLVGLFLIDPIIAISSLSLVGGVYALTYFVIKKKLVHHGERVAERVSAIQNILSESFIGVKDIKLRSLELNYIHMFEAKNNLGLRSMAFISLAGDLPKFVVESISFGAILLLAIIFLLTGGEVEQIIGLLSIYALAGYKLLPTLQQIYKSVSSMSANGSVVNALIKEFNHKCHSLPSVVQITTREIRTIGINKLSYSYPGASSNALSDVSLSLEKGKIYALAGHSGSGKSTLADILLGLLVFEDNQLIVNGNPLKLDELHDYQNSLSYVAQQIFILDDSVISNVAFGSIGQKNDKERVKQALRLANALEFCENLPDGLNTKLGQDGKLLSGGQKQRIGIARALYKVCEVLILDEPTSALDMESEYEFLKTINELKTDLIVLIISHRPASVRMSDQIILMKNGTIDYVGDYEQLIKQNSEFREMLEKSLGTSPQ